MSLAVDEDAVNAPKGSIAIRLFGNEVVLEGKPGLYGMGKWRRFEVVVWSVPGDTWMIALQQGSTNFTGRGPDLDQACRHVEQQVRTLRTELEQLTAPRVNPG